MDSSIIIIIISILVILLWFYFMKYSEQESKFLPVMLKQKQVISKLKDENVKMKSELKYLHNYKNDVSKTFQILDNELVMINDRIKQTETVPSNDQVQSSTQTGRSSFQTSFNRSILSTLLNSASMSVDPEPMEPMEPMEPIEPTENEQPGGDLFNIFNRFLTGQNVSNFEFSIPSDVPSVPSVNTDTPIIQRGSVQFSTNILPLNNTYRQFLLNRGGGSQHREPEPEPEYQQEEPQQDNEQEHKTSII